MSGGKLISLSIVLLITFIIEILFSFKSHIFIREFILFFIFFIGAIILLYGIGAKTRWGAPWFLVFFSLQILNFIYIHYNMVKQYPGWLVIALLFSVIGLLISVASIKKKIKKTPKPEVVDIKPEKKITKKTTKKKTKKK